MAELNFSTGLVTYSLNGKVDVQFNPSDQNFVERLYSTFEQLDRQQEAYKAEIEAAKGSKKVFEVARARSEEMRGMIDGLFQQPVCESLFGTLNVYALADGLPVWCNLLLAVMDVVGDNMDEQEKKTNPRVQKYLEKYKKYQK